MMEFFIRRLSVAFRTLWRNRRFTVAAAGVLALGIGVSTTFLTVVDTVVLRPLPFRDSSKLVAILETLRANDTPRAAFTVSEYVVNRDFEQWQKRNRTLDPMAGWIGHEVTVSGRGEPKRLMAVAVTPDFFRLFGARTILGRPFAANEDRRGHDHVVVLSGAYWRERFGGASAVIGQTLTVNGFPDEIIGVLDPAFQPVLPHFPAHPALYIPSSRTLQGDRVKFTVFNAAGRLRPDITIQQARSDMQAIASALAAENPRSNGGRGVQLMPLADVFSQNVRSEMLLLVAITTCLLLLSCGNVANLLLARSIARYREICVRAVLGATPSDIIALLLTESVLLALIGGLAGLPLAYWGTRLIATTVPSGVLPRQNAIAMDPRAILISFSLSVLTGILCGLVPAIEARRWSSSDLSQSMKDIGAAIVSVRSRRLHRLLVICEFALALALISEAGMFFQSLAKLREVNLGFHANKVLTATMVLSRTKYPGPEERGEVVRQILERLKRVPGVASAAATNSIPSSNGFSFVVSGIQAEGGVVKDVPVLYRSVSPDYFHIMGLRLQKGRFLSAEDAFRGDAVVVNQRFVRQCWPDIRQESLDPVGRGMRWGQFSWKVVGVVGNTLPDGPRSEARPEIYVSYTQNLSPNTALVLALTRPPPQVAPAIRNAVFSIDPDLPIDHIATIEQLEQTQLASPYFYAHLALFFAILALLLAAMGIYAVVSHSVTQDVRGIGVTPRIVSPLQRSFPSN